MKSESDENSASNRICAFVNRLSRLNEIDPLTGMRKTWFLFPQYLINAMLGCAIAVDERFFTENSLNLFSLSLSR